MDKLVKKDNCYFVYGDYQGEEQILFQSPLESDLRQYLNDTRKCVDLTPVTNLEDIYEKKGYFVVDYWRMYFRHGWQGRWMSFQNNPNVKPNQDECLGVNRIIDFLCEHFPNGCTVEMEQYLKDHFSEYQLDGNRWWLQPNDHYLIAFDTTFGNHDYPVRIYVYRDQSEYVEVDDSTERNF